MSDSERRFRQRYDAAPLKLELRLINLLGRPGKRHQAVARNFSTGGVSIETQIKMKPGKRVLLSITSDDHSLQAVPAMVLRADSKNELYCYALQFNMEQVSEAASRGADTVLQHLEFTLREYTQREQTIPL